MFNLKHPCITCPFRKGAGKSFRLSAERLEQIRTGTAFQCHKTVDYDAWEDGGDRSGDRPEQCAGLMTILHQEGADNDIMRFARIMGIKFDALDPRHEVYPSWDEAVADHREELNES